MYFWTNLYFHQIGNVLWPETGLLSRLHESLFTATKNQLPTELLARFVLPYPSRIWIYCYTADGRDGDGEKRALLCHNQWPVRKPVTTSKLGGRMKKKTVVNNQYLWIPLQNSPFGQWALSSSIHVPLWYFSALHVTHQRSSAPFLPFSCGFIGCCPPQDVSVFLVK